MVHSCHFFSKQEFLLHIKAQKTITYGMGKTPFGNACIAAVDQDIYALTFVPKDKDFKACINDIFPFLELTNTSIDHTKVQQFLDTIASNHPVSIVVSGTPFQHQIWQTLLTIQPGQILTYQDVADRSGNPKAVRAAGTAIGNNPVSWLIPCHRVCPKGGGIGNYRWGSSFKQKLLDYERIHHAQIA